MTSKCVKRGSILLVVKGNANRNRRKVPLHAAGVTVIFKEENSESWRGGGEPGASAADGVHGGAERRVPASNSRAVPLRRHRHPEEAGRTASGAHVRPALHAVTAGPQGLTGQACCGPSSHCFLLVW